MFDGTRGNTTSGSAPTLADRMRTITEHFTNGDYDAVASAVEAHPIEVWYGLPPDTLREMLRVIADSGHSVGPVGQALYAYLHDSGNTPADRIISSDVLARLPDSIAPMFRVMLAFSHRISGRADISVAMLDELQHEHRALPTFFTPNGGVDLWVTVQTGVTCMLAGEFTRALASFTEVEFQPVDSALAFLSRDAHVKAALIHAAYGDTGKARLKLGHARRIPRTISWAEALLDANAMMAEAIIEPDNDRALELLDRIPLRDVGEMWPFYAIALHRVFAHSGDLHGLGRRMAMLEKVSFSFTPGVGFAGSVLALIRASMSLHAHDLTSARTFLDRCDAGHVLTRLMNANLDLQLGHPHRAIEGVRNLKADIEGLRHLGLTRFAVLADAYLQLEYKELALDYLRSAEQFALVLQPEDLSVFSPAVRQLGARHIANWPESPVGSPALAEDTIDLTNRERQILQVLARTPSRQEMADQLFISVNTLKTHLTAVYRKMGVSNRDAALAKAELTGWI